MFERYTERARRAIFYARYQAAFLPSNEIKTGLILIGIIREGDPRSAAVRILRDRETDLRSALGVASPSGKPLADLMRDVPFDQKAKMALAFSTEEAELDKSFYIDTDDLLLGILRFPNEASDALQTISFDLAKVRDKPRHRSVKRHSRKTLYHRIFGTPFWVHRSSLIKLLSFLAVCVLAILLIRWLN